jgi:serine/threonine-protein kinase SRPK3
MSRSPLSPPSLPVDEPIDEEVIPGYDPRYRYHPNPGDVLDGVYELKAKIGWGGQATVWLAELNDR